MRMLTAEHGVLAAEQAGFYEHELGLLST